MLLPNYDQRRSVRLDIDYSFCLCFLVYAAHLVHISPLFCYPLIVLIQALFMLYLYILDALTIAVLIVYLSYGECHFSPLANHYFLYFHAFSLISLTIFSTVVFVSMLDLTPCRNKPELMLINNFNTACLTASS